MGEAKLRGQPVLECIYCGSRDQLSDEHVIPLALGGKLVLPKASCLDCAKITRALERRLLRGPWWPYRRVLGLKSRRPTQQPSDFPVTLKRVSGEVFPVLVAAADYPGVLMFDFDTPALVSGNKVEHSCAGRAVIKMLGPNPRAVLLDGVMQLLAPDDKLEFPVNMDASDVVRFLAKVALGYAVRRRGLSALKNVFLRSIILRDPGGGLAYVGCDKQGVATMILPTNGLHGLVNHLDGDLLSVFIQLFRDGGPPMPIYQVVVGRLWD